MINAAAFAEVVGPACTSSHRAWGGVLARACHCHRPCVVAFLHCPHEGMKLRRISGCCLQTWADSPGVARVVFVSSPGNFVTRMRGALAPAPSVAAARTGSEN